MPTIQQIRPRLFERMAEPRPMRMTPRVLNMIRYVARHRFLTSAQLARLDGGSHQNVLRCLRALYDNGFLDRPVEQLAQLPLLGPRPMVYGLTRKGAKALRESGYDADDMADWSEKNRRAGSIFIEHTLAVADFITAIEAACRTSSIRFIGQEEFIARTPESTRAQREPLRWRPSEKPNANDTVIPDGAFGLEFPDRTASFFLLEVDRGTMPVMRRGRERTSFARKIVSYYEGWRNGIHTKQFGLRQLRILTVTTSRHRVVHMIEAVRRNTDGKGINLFLFADQEALFESDPLRIEWLSGKGEKIRIS